MTKGKSTMVMMDNAKWFGDEVFKLSRNCYLFGLGTFATAEEEMRGVVDRMMHKGETIDKDGKSVVGKATGKAKELGTMVEDQVQNTMAVALNRAGVPSRNEIRTLIRRVEELTEKVDTLAGGLKIGAALGLLLGFSISFDMYSVTNWMNLTAASVEPLLWMVRVSLGAGAIGLVLGMGSTGNDGITA